ARSRAAEKHGGELDRVTATVLEGQVAELEQSPEELLAIHAALDRLAEVDARAAQVVTLQYFAGFSTSEVADALGVSDRTVRNDWGFARAWMLRKLASDAAE
ncbi:MAG: ECF-type sigma factor, partial [Acidobacteriota bacterium]